MDQAHSIATLTTTQTPTPTHTTQHHTHTTHTHHTTYYYWCAQHARARATCKAACGSSTQSTSFKATAISLKIIPRYSCFINHPWKTAFIAAVGTGGKSSISCQRYIWTASCLLTVCRWTRRDPIVTD